MPKSAAVAQTAELEMLPLKEISESPTNPRRYFSEEQLQELAADVKVRGVLQPVMVRRKGKGHELVFGHRRFRAAKLAGLKSIPAIVRELTDREVLEVQLAENLRRADLTPLEEADGYRELSQTFQLSADQIAERIGKSKSYVYQRIKLCELGPAGRKALEDGRLPASHAVLIARIPVPEMQEKALLEVIGEAKEWEFSQGELMAHKEAEEHIAELYMTKLSTASFDPKDADLVPEVGACTTCPHRTGNQPELYPDAKNANVCTNLPCFQKKKAAGNRIARAEYKEKGQKYIGEKPNLFSTYSGGLNYQAADKYVELKAKCEEDPKGRAWKELLGDDVQVIVAVDSKGKARQLVEKKAAKEALAAGGHEFAKKVQVREQSSGERIDWKAQQEAREKEQKRAEERLERVLARIGAAAVRLDRFDEPFWRLIAKVVLRDGWDLGLTAKSRGCDRGETLVKKLDGLRAPELVALILEGAIELEFRHGYENEDEVLTTVAALLGVDLKSTETPPAAAETKRGTCRICGCTEDRACPGGCAWVDETETLCTRCAVPFDVVVEDPKGAPVDGGNLCGVYDGKKGDACFLALGHEGAHSNGKRTWPNKPKKAAGGKAATA